MAALVVALGLALVGCAGSGLSKSADTDLEFAGEMARLGNWREAIFRWQRVIEQGRDDARIHNNLAVAYERLGEYEKAAEEYEKALERGGDSRQIEENYRQFLRFYRDYKERELIDEPGATREPSDS